MALLNSTARFYYRSPRSAATPISQDPPSSLPSATPTPSLPSDPINPSETRVILPKKKPLKWSTGVAPGEYGGPPTTTKLRKYWGGEAEDPLATDDFMWNKEFMGRMKRLIQPSDSSLQPPSPSKEDSGFLSLNRAMSLDSVDIDLSRELTSPPPKPVLQLQVEAARRGRLSAESGGNAAPRWRFVPTRREQEKWDRANKAATGGSEVTLRESKRERGDPKVLAAQSREQYFKLKRKLQILTLGIGGVGLFSAFVSYSPEIAARGAIGQPRLLVPVALVMIYNRWNGILVPDYGFMHLDLIPMLVGFFTYKVATFIQAIEEALTIVENKQQV
ncbi:protein CONSERVED ONLY IN THE GREEN LINEAGE 160, chloroplastic isoform X2 [Magnolia sinica]|uniref:protein CONSERVED ONLY IN THE GREEN LINEAGE 160, chloroplastic isoform X2 n=1 Tax=Magnolia sinica TaxID=86752 RepID=UPI00265994BE|nr:protein CONSERVED ONLY IN THE GREEN LINEAGE 160, chloroplastic isoform X2 [Magnolia sinica]